MPHPYGRLWHPPTSINKLQVMQNAALRACTGCTHDTNIQHLHDETNILPIQNYLQLHASQVRQKAPYPSHPLYRYTTTSARPEVRGTADVGWRSLNPLPINPPRTHSRLYHHMFFTDRRAVTRVKPTTFNNSRYTTNIPTDTCTVTTADIKANIPTYTQLLSLSTSLQETITKYCAHTHRKSAVP